MLQTVVLQLLWRHGSEGNECRNGDLNAVCGIRVLLVSFIAYFNLACVDVHFAR